MDTSARSLACVCLREKKAKKTKLCVHQRQFLETQRERKGCVCVCVCVESIRSRALSLYALSLSHTHTHSIPPPFSLSFSLSLSLSLSLSVTLSHTLSQTHITGCGRGGRRHPEGPGAGKISQSHFPINFPGRYNMTIQLTCEKSDQGHLVEWDRCLKLLRSLPLLQGTHAEL